MPGALVLSAVLDWVAQALQSVGIREVAGVLVLGAVLWYGWRLRRVGSMASEGLRLVLAAAGAILVLLVLGIIPDLDIARAMQLGEQVLAFFKSVI